MKTRSSKLKGSEEGSESPEPTKEPKQQDIKEDFMTTEGLKPLSHLESPAPHQDVEHSHVQGEIAAVNEKVDIILGFLMKTKFWEQRGDPDEERGQHQRGG